MNRRENVMEEKKRFRKETVQGEKDHRVKAVPRGKVHGDLGVGG